MKGRVVYFVVPLCFEVMDLLSFSNVCHSLRKWCLVLCCCFLFPLGALRGSSLKTENPVSILLFIVGKNVAAGKVGGCMFLSKFAGTRRVIIIIIGATQIFFFLQQCIEK